MANPSAVHFHESGHAGIYLMCPEDAQIIELTADASNESGLCRFRARRQFPNAIIAGYVSESRYLRGKDWQPPRAMFGDYMHLRDIADAAAIVGLEGLPKLWDETAALLDCEWHRIEAIASALSVRGQLDGSAVEAIWQGLN